MFCEQTNYSLVIPLFPAFHKRDENSESEHDRHGHSECSEHKGESRGMYRISPHVLDRS
jgi:hypothetical protein